MIPILLQCSLLFDSPLRIKPQALPSYVKFRLLILVPSHQATIRVGFQRYWLISCIKSNLSLKISESCCKLLISFSKIPIIIGLPENKNPIAALRSSILHPLLPIKVAIFELSIRTYLGLQYLNLFGL